MTVRVSDTTWLDATAQADLIRRSEVSPKELTEAAIARIEAVNPRLDAVIETRFDAARQEADGGEPAISLPLHWTPDGLPVGVQLVATYGREDILIRVASQLEQAAPWSERHPPTHA